MPAACICILPCLSALSVMRTGNCKCMLPITVVFHCMLGGAIGCYGEGTQERAGGVGCGLGVVPSGDEACGEAVEIVVEVGPATYGEAAELAEVERVIHACVCEVVCLYLCFLLT